MNDIKEINGKLSQDPIINNRNSEDAVSLLDIISVFTNHWKLIFWMTLAGALLILLVALSSKLLPPDSPWNFMPNQYKAGVKIKLNEDAVGSSYSSVFSSGNNTLAGLLTGQGGIQSSTVLLVQEKTL